MALQTIKQLNHLADALKRLIGETVEGFSVFVGSVFGAILDFPGKAPWFFNEHT